MRLYQTTFERNASRYMQNGSVEAFGKVYTIRAGNDDDVTVYHDKESVYVVSENHSLDYIGLERFNRESGECQFDIFFQVDDGSGDKEYLLNLSRYPTKIRFMLQWDM